MSKYLFIAAHCDDETISSAGTILKLRDQGHHITIISLSHIYSGLNLKDEWNACMDVLNPSERIIHNFTTRRFNEHRQDILQEFYQLSKNNYDFVFTHSPSDINQDHSVVGYESIRAFKNTNLITYVGEWNQRTATKDYFVRLEKYHIERKMIAINCYKSQEKRPYMHPDFIWSNAMNNGVMCGTKFAEAFKVVNLIQ